MDKGEWTRWTRGVGGLENGTIFMDVICVSSLKALKEMVLILNEV